VEGLDILVVLGGDFQLALLKPLVQFVDQLLEIFALLGNERFKLIDAGIGIQRPRNLIVQWFDLLSDVFNIPLKSGDPLLQCNDRCLILTMFFV
jgi:hypothetical protein